MQIVPLSAIRQFVLAQRNDRKVQLMTTNISEIGTDGNLGCILGQYAKSHGIKAKECSFEYIYAANCERIAKVDHPRGVMALFDTKGLNYYQPFHTYGELKKRLK